MTSQKIYKLIHFFYLILFFVTPLLISLQSSELFEFPKMIFVYAMTIIIASLWLYNIILKGQIYFKRSYFDPIFILIFLTQAISTYLSIHPQTSVFGYYARFHGGLLSTICYLILAWGLITHANRRWIKNVLLASIFSASLVALYGLAEHFGIDAHVWIQDVQNRVFSTLGQPNWLSAFLITLLPLTIYYYQHPPKANHTGSYIPTFTILTLANLTISYFLVFLLTHQILPVSGMPLFYFTILFTILSGISLHQLEKIDAKFPFLRRLTFPILFSLFISVILFTKSRSGIIALFASLFVYFISSTFQTSSPCVQREQAKNFRVRKAYLKKSLLLIACCLLLVAIIGTEWTPNFAQLLGKNNKPVKNPIAEAQKNPSLPPLAETISDSTDIRKVVWQGAIDVFKYYLLFGSGTETFAYSYYQYRPREHNDLSEWDFLYNKAHNEYLNFLANNGIIGVFAIFLPISAIIISTTQSQQTTSHQSTRKQSKQITKYFKAAYQNKWFILFAFISLISLTLYLTKPLFIKSLISKLLIYPPLLIYLGFPFVLSFITCLLILKPQNHQSHPLDPALLSMLTAIFITNFYGFSVVNIALLSFLIPIILVTVKDQSWLVEINFAKKTYQNSGPNPIKALGSIILSIIFIFGFVSVFNYFLADKLYNQAKTLSQAGRLLDSEAKINQAISLKKEAYYYLEKAKIQSQVAYTLWRSDPTDSADLISQYTQSAELSLIEAFKLNPVHQSILKPGASIYLTLSNIDPNYYYKVKTVLELAQKISPTDPQLCLNIALVDEKLGMTQDALAQYQKATQLKPNYRLAWLFLAKIYEQLKQTDKATEIYQFILENIDPNDGTSLEKLKQE